MYPQEVEARRGGRHDLGDGERPPYEVDVSEGSEDQSRGNESNELTHDRNDHTVHTLSESLEQRTRYYTESRDREVNAYDPEGGDSHLGHGIRSFKEREHDLRDREEKGGSDTHDGCGVSPRKSPGLHHPVATFGPEVVSDDRHDTAVESEDRHEDKALHLVISTEHGNCRR